MRRASVAIAFAIVVAGCAAATSSSASAPTSATFSASTGGIKGKVVDDSLSPIEGAIVALDLDEKATTDEGGMFVFSNVEPGEHTVHVQALSFEPKAMKVEVVAGEVRELSLALVELPIQDPHHSTSIHDGVTFCGTSVRQPGQSKPSYLQICGVLYYYGSQDLDKFRLDYQLGLEGLAGFFGESVWTKNSAASGGFNVLWDIFSDDDVNIYQIASNGSAKSPMPVRVEADHIRSVSKSNGAKECAAEEGDCHIASFHANYGETLGPGAPADAAVAFQQRYQVYLTAFYYGELPAVFSAVGDG